MSVWEDLVGQERAVDVLRAAVDADRWEDVGTGQASAAPPDPLDSATPSDPAAREDPAAPEASPPGRRAGGTAHAWLITGPPGSGRSSAARAFAAALQCPQRGCGTCRTCREVLAGRHPDVQVVATEKVTITMEEVRSLVTLAHRPPTTGRRRVIVVEDADRMAERTSNVLLKAVEEPPDRTVWLLCAPSPADVVVTIRSRCRSLALRVPSVQAVADLLHRRDGVEADLARACARAAQSHIGMARRLARDPEARARREAVLDIPRRAASVGQAVLAAGDLVEVAQADARAAGEERDAVERADLLRTLGAPASGAMPPALRAQLRAFEEDCRRRATRIQRDVLDRAVVDLLSLYRDVLVVQFGAEEGEGGVDLVNAERAEDVRRLARRTGPAGTLRCIEALELARTRLAGNVAPLLTVESMLLSLVQA